MDDLLALENIGIISKVSAELENHHICEGDEESIHDMAEFLLELANESRTLPEFKKKLTENEAIFPDGLPETLFTIIKRMTGESISTQKPAFVAPKREIEEEERAPYKHTSNIKREEETEEHEETRDCYNEHFTERNTSITSRKGDVKKEEVDERDSRTKNRSRSRSKSSSRSRSRSKSRSSSKHSHHHHRHHHSHSRHSHSKHSHHHSHSKHSRHHHHHRHESESRSKSPSKSDSDNEDTSNLDDRPITGKIYRGTIVRILDFGVIVKLDGVKHIVDVAENRRSQRNAHDDGLVHISKLINGRVEHPADVVILGQPVWVKVIRSEEDRTFLSMRDVDQQTGADLTPPSKSLPYEQPSLDRTRTNPPPLKRPRGLFNLEDDTEQIGAAEPERPVRRLTTPELYEQSKMLAAGVLDPRERPMYDPEFGSRRSAGDSGAIGEDIEEDVDIEVREDEPTFLEGRGAEINSQAPIKMSANPSGSLADAAAKQTSLAKQRREMAEERRNAEIAGLPKDASKTWEDPLARDDERYLAQGLTGVSLDDPGDFSIGGRSGGGGGGWQEPEWRRSVEAGVRYGKPTTLSIQEQRRSLPIYPLKDAFVRAVRDNQFLIVIGETGSGKTTQMTQYLAESGMFVRNGKKIGCTQPRRVAAISVAKRVAEEFPCKLGDEVGYSVRFDDVTSEKTIIKYMTDGMLLRECLADPEVRSYSVVILDEAHERTINTDVLFGLLKKAASRRPNFRLVITSATLDADKFSRFFCDAAIFTIPGRCYAVDILYRKEPEPDYLDAALTTIMQIHITEPRGDILVFLTGQEEIDTACEILYNRMKAMGPRVPRLIILPIYSALPQDIQTRVFEPAPEGARKCVIATNIAETSITIDGIFYVVDPGFVKQNVYDPKLGMDSLVICPISQACAKQRAGRAGRTGPGKCFRLYTELAFKNEMLPATVPEIQRTNLGNTVLTLKAMGIDDLLHFDFMDPPASQTLVKALHHLYALGALDGDGILTSIGRKMAEFPLDPPLSKVLIISTTERFHCSDEALTIVAMLSTQSPFYRPRDRQAQADQKHAKFFQPEGDHITQLAVYQAWKASKFSKPWCYENFVDERTMRGAQDVRKQLTTIMDRYGLPIESCGKNYTALRRAFVSGFFEHAAKKDSQSDGYKTIVENQMVYIHPSSAVFQRHPDWVIYHELVLTSKEYMRSVIAIEPRWLPELAPNYFTIVDPNRMSKLKRQEKLESLFNRNAADQNAWRLSKRKY